MRLPRRRSMVASRPRITGPRGTKASSSNPSSTRAAARPLQAKPGNPENAGHRAPARRQDGSDQQHLGMAPTPLEKERRKAEDHRGEAGWQSEHGGAPVAGTPQPSRSPASLPQARKWPNASLELSEQAD